MDNKIKEIEENGLKWITEIKNYKIESVIPKSWIGNNI